MKQFITILVLMFMCFVAASQDSASFVRSYESLSVIEKIELVKSWTVDAKMSNYVFLKERNEGPPVLRINEFFDYKKIAKGSNPLTHKYQRPKPSTGIALAEIAADIYKDIIMERRMRGKN